MTPARRRLSVVLAFAALVAVLALLVAAAMGRSDPHGHVVMLGRFSPFRAAALALLASAALALLAWLRAPSREAALAAGALGLTVAAAGGASLLGYLDATLGEDWTLMRLPPTEETGSPLGTALSFVRVTLLSWIALGGGLLLTGAVWGRGASLSAWLSRAAAAALAAVTAVLEAAGRQARAHPVVVATVLVSTTLVVNVLGIRYRTGDTATFSIVGRMILNGGVPYRDAWDIKFPAVYYLSAAFEALERLAQSVSVPHGLAAGLAQTAVVVITVAVFHRVAREVAPRETALAAAALFMLLAGDPILNGGGHLTEVYALLPALLAVLFGLRALTGEAVARHAFAVGLWSAVASLVRPLAAVPLAALVVTMALEAVRTRRMGPATRTAVAGAVGFAVPWTIVLAALARAGALDAFIDLPVGFNRFVGASFPATTRFAAALTAAGYAGVLLPVLAAVVVRAGRAVVAEREASARARLTLLLVLVVLEAMAITSVGRVSYHYFLQAVPAVCLLGAAMLGRVRTAAAAPSRAAFTVAAVLLAFQAVVGYALYLARPAATVGAYAAVRAVAEAARARTAPTDRLFIAESRQREAVYYYADRLPATRYLYLENAVNAYTRGRYVDEIVRSLEAAPPRLAIVDTSPQATARPIADHIERHYRLVGRVESPPITWLLYEPPRP